MNNFKSKSFESDLFITAITKPAIMKIYRKIESFKFFAGRAIHGIFLAKVSTPSRKKEMMSSKKQYP